MAGCAVPPLPPAASSTPPAHFATAQGSAASPLPPLPDAAWWRLFADPSLDAAVQRALRDSPPLHEALARLAQARALARAAGAATVPQIGLNASASRQGGPLVNAAGDQGPLLRAGIGVEFEFDLGGRLSMADQAAQLDAAQRDALVQWTRLQLQADVVGTWLSLRSLDTRRALLRRTAAAQHEAARLLDGRARAGLSASADGAAARAEAVALDAQALALDREHSAQQIALARLVGAHHAELAGSLGPALPTAGPAVAAAWPDPPVVPAGIPSSVLSRRSDVAAAERAVQAARQRVGMAGAAALPGIGLTAAGGVASAELGQLLRSSARSWGLAALLSLPVFDGGRREAETEAARAAHEAAVAAWRGCMLTALSEVEQQLSALQHLAGEAAARRSAHEQSLRVAALVRSRLERGLAGTLELFDAERRALRDALALAEVQAARHAATVGLVRALGGGWGDALAKVPTGEGRVAVALPPAGRR